MVGRSGMVRRLSASNGTPTNMRTTSRRSRALAAALLALLVTLIACAGVTPSAPTAPSVPPRSQSTTATSGTTATARPASLPSTGTPAQVPPTRTAPATASAVVTTAATPAVAAACAPGVELIGYSDALDKTTFADTAVGGLSALRYDPSRDRYLVLVDNERETPARVYTLHIPLADGKLGTPTIEAITILRDENGQPFTGRTLDGEGLALGPDGELLVASETEPSLRRFAPDGRQRAQLPVPARFLVKPQGEATANQTFESLGVTPDGVTLFTAPEGPLAPDGFATPVRARLRLRRYGNGPAFAPAAQYFYLAEPAQGLAEIVALGPDDLLAVERGFIPELGNTVRLFHLSLAGQPDVAARASLADPNLIPLPKTLVVDLGLCPAGTATHPGKQTNRLLDNVESVALGPRLPDGRQSLLLVSDDNFAADQVTRVYLLAFRP